MILRILLCLLVMQNLCVVGSEGQKKTTKLRNNYGLWELFLLYLYFYIYYLCMYYMYMF